MSRTILLVDDDRRVTRAMSVTLGEVAPWEILVANSGREALAVLAANPVDVIVSDEGMPDMRGSDLLCHVRREYPDTMRIILTGKGNLATAIHAVNEAAIYRFLTKPCRTDDLRDTIESALQARSERPQPADAEAGVQLDEALASVWMAFQPIISMQAGRAIGYEALVRTHHPVLSDPMLLLGAAERLGRVPEVDLHILERVAGEVAGAPPDSLLFVNLHPRSLDEPSLYTAKNSLAAVAERVVIEITERASIDSIPDVLDKIKALRALGFRIAIDDLGAGYSGLTSLLSLKPEFAKFDKELTQRLPDSPTHRKLVRWLEVLCRDLGLRTIAEGVETREQRDALMVLGCDHLQGYLFARPQNGFIAVDPRI